jgi:hypothetical protein
MRDAQGVRWLTIREAVDETRMSRPTIMAWIKDGLPSMSIRGRLWVPEPELFARLRRSLLENPRVKTRWRNRQRD